MQALKRAGVRYAPYYYSYPEGKNYRRLSRFNGLDYYLAGGTHVDLATAARRLDAQIREVLTSRRSPNYDPKATFDLVGHGLGGVVAAYWVVAYATPAEVARVHSLVAFDSPLQGLSGTISKQAQGYWSGAVATDLLRGVRARRIAVINDPRRGLLAKLPRVLTISSSRDILVPGGRAWVGPHKAPWNLTLAECLTGDVLCDQSTMRDTTALMCAAGWIRSTHPADTAPLRLVCGLNLNMVQLSPMRKNRRVLKQAASVVLAKGAVVLSSASLEQLQPPATGNTYNARASELASRQVCMWESCNSRDRRRRRACGDVDKWAGEDVPQQEPLL